MLTPERSIDRECPAEPLNLDRTRPTSALEHLAASERIFDKDTQHITGLVNNLGAREKDAGHPPSSNIVAVKHGWLRGALAAIGRYILKKGAEFTKVIRDGIIGGAAFEVAKQPESLVAAIFVFLVKARTALLQPADAFPATFGWLAECSRFSAL
jgi:hypothetical protein